MSKKTDSNSVKCLYPSCRQYFIPSYKGEVIGPECKNKLMIIKFLEDGTNQEQHFTTKGYTKNWIVDDKKNVLFFDGTYVNPKKSYRKVFYHVNAWDSKWESFFNKQMEEEVVNYILLKQPEDMTTMEVNKLKGFAFLQMVRSMYKYNPEKAEEFFITFSTKHQFLDKLPVRFESVEGLNLNDLSIINYELKGGHFILGFPLSKGKVMLFTFSYPKIDIHKINISKRKLQIRSLGSTDQQVVLSEYTSSDRIKKIQKHNLKIITKFNERNSSNQVVGNMMSPIVYESLSKYGLLNKDNIDKEISRITNKDAHPLYLWLCEARELSYQKNWILSWNVIDIDFDEIFHLYNQGKTEEAKAKAEFMINWIRNYNK